MMHLLLYGKLMDLYRKFPNVLTTASFVQITIAVIHIAQNATCIITEYLTDGVMNIRNVGIKIWRNIVKNVEDIIEISNRSIVIYVKNALVFQPPTVRYVEIIIIATSSIVINVVGLFMQVHIVTYVNLIAVLLVMRNFMWNVIYVMDG